MILLDFFLTCLLALLPSNDYRLRERAQHCLRSLLPCSASALEAGAKSTDPETAHACRIVLTPFRNDQKQLLVYQVIPAGWRKFPWIDLAPQWQGDGLREFLSAAQRELHCYSLGAPYWSAYRLATEWWVRQMIYDGVPEIKIRQLLEVMRARELVYYAVRTPGDGP